ncbi:phospholipid phosphatase-related protein type 4-like [Corythoichthys intestinalis]|uniref:phospholipid phosphatase-related protein type 4-like n=1 Tax=Corythoichthys intestinalis TaxID=161448 RepID=UPI0025A62A2E|nr:phospholipid phosphatase-related protein type 4-like [Corythoichthys intestinalis]
MTTLERLKFGKETKDSVTLLPCFYFVELPILALSVISLYFLELTDLFQPVHSGYSCNDKSLSLPYVTPQKEVCPLPLLFSLAFAIPTTTILIGEAILFCYLSRRSSTIQTEANISAAGCNFNSYIRRVVRFIGVHIFGLCVTALITDIFQLSTGQHTPYWLDVCKPNLTHINVSTCDEAFILEDICSGQDTPLIIAGRKSFPSQHASMAGFAAVYVSMYLNTVLTDSTKLLKPLLVFSFIMLAILAGLTRIIQFRNHPVDVYCGWILGLAVASYLGIFAVGSFRPGEDKSKRRKLSFTLRKPPPSSFHSVCQSEVNNSHQVGHHMLSVSQAEPISIRTTPHSLSPEPPKRILTRSASYREPSQSNLKVTNADLEMIIPPSPMTACDKNFNSSTLPRNHGGSSSEGCRVPRRHASIHTSMDSTRSKQLLSQWKNKNDKRKLSLQVMDGIRPASLSPQRDIHLRYPSETPAGGMDAELHAGSHLSPAAGQEAHIPASYIKIAASCVQNKTPQIQNGGSGYSAGPRMIIQSRPGSSQLVHIPEEENSTVKDQESESEDSTFDVLASAKQKWVRVTEKSTLPCRPLSAGGQPRLMQVIGFSKPPGLLNSRSEDGGSTVSCTGSIRYRTLMDQDPSPPASTTGVMEGQALERSGSIIRVEAHPESNKPVVKPPSTDGSGSWRWTPVEKRPSLRQSAFNIDDIPRNADSCDSLKDAGSSDGRQSVAGNKFEGKLGVEGVPSNHPHVVYPLHQSHSNFQDPNSCNPLTPNSVFSPPFHYHPQSVTTIRVTPVEGTAASSDGSSDSQSAASSSRESTLRRKDGAEVHFGQDSGNNVFKGESGHFFQDNPVHHNRQLQGMFGRPSPHPPPTLPRPIMTHPPPQSLGLAFKEA